MRKGEVFVSVEHTKRNDPVIIATVFGIAGVIFFILAIAVPSAMKNSADPKYCAPTDWLQRDEQTVCRPGEKKTYIGKIFSDVPSLVKYYRVSRESLQVTKTRTHRWTGTVDLSKGPFIFPVTSSSSLKYDLRANCTKGVCETVQFYWLYHEYFDKANESGTFDENMYSYKYKDFSKRVVITDVLDGSEFYYIIIANKNQESIVNYQLTVSYVVYDMKNAKPVNCSKTECVFEDVSTADAIVMEYIDDEEKGPSRIGAQIKSAQGSYGGAVFFAILFALLTLGAFVVCVLFILQQLGKINLYKQVPKNVSGGDSGSYQPPEVAGERAVRVTVGDD